MSGGYGKSKAMRAIGGVGYLHLVIRCLCRRYCREGAWFARNRYGGGFAPAARGSQVSLGLSSMPARLHRAALIAVAGKAISRGSSEAVRDLCA